MSYDIDNNIINEDLNEDLNEKLQIQVAKNETKKNETKKKEKTDNCQELKNIAYKTMLQNGNNIISETQNISNDEKITTFLESESHANKQESWIKLDKTQKLIRLNNYVDNILKEKYDLSENEINNTKKYLQKCIKKKNLQKTKEITYNKQKNFIENIPYFQFIEASRTFILKKDDKHISTVKCLPPEKKSKVKTLKIHDD